MMQAAQNKLIAAFVIIMVLTFLTYSRNLVWKTEASLWEDCLKKSPNNPKALMNLAVAYMNEKRLQESEVVFDKFFSLDSSKNEMKPMFSLAKLYIDQERYADAIKIYRRLEPLFEQNVLKDENNFKKLSKRVDVNMLVNEIHYNLGRSYIFVNDYDSAIIELQKAEKIMPSDINAKHLTAFSYREKGDYEKAAKKWEETLLLDPKFDFAHEGLGMIYLENLHDRKKALYHLTETLRLVPNHPSKEWINDRIKELSAQSK